MTRFLKYLLLLLIASLLFAAAYWFNVFRPSFDPGDMVTLIPDETENPDGTIIRDTPDPEKPLPSKNLPVEVQSVVTGLDTPWSLVFTSPERLLVTERVGRVRVVENGNLRETPLHTFSEVTEKGEEGLMSMALDPEYPQNKFIYFALAYPVGEQLFVKVERFQDAGERLIDPVTILDRIPAAQFHSGCRIAFGPDGKLYVTTGDATDRNLAQDMQSLAGKVLRLNSDGSIPADNPFPGSPVWSYGHRNPQGIAWQPDSGQMYGTEHGPSVFDGPTGGDEVNLIERGANYGWPLVSHEKRRAGTVAPVIVYTPSEAPASLMIYSGRLFPEWRGHLFFGALKGEGLMRIRMSTTDPSQVASYEKLREVQYGRIREVIEGPDGAIYFTTSNRDGRGSPAALDDRIFRIKPRQ